MGVATWGDNKTQSFEKIREIPDKMMPPLMEYIQKPKELFIVRAQGGVGDILNSRMLFEDLKKISGDLKITYAVPQQFMPLLYDHPFIDEVVDCDAVDMSQYAFRKDITNKCGMYENSQKLNGGVDKHRSDIWAEYIGYTLEHHNQHIGFYESEIKDARYLLRDFKGKRKIAIQPISAHPSKNWPLDKWQESVNRIKNKYKKTEILCFHNNGVKLDNVTHFNSLDLRSWMAAVNECNIIITVATAMFCLANGLHKPTVSIFGCEDLDIYAKYFPESINVQHYHRKNGGPECCPCWNGWYDCKKLGQILANTENFPPPCLADVAVDEVMERVELCLKD